MRKTHLILLVVTALTALFSAYSLAAINQVYDIDFAWYSSYHNRYSSELRDTTADKWYLTDLPKDLEFKVIERKEDWDSMAEKSAVGKHAVSNTSFDAYFLLYCTLGTLNSPEYRVKIIDVAQRGNVVEVKVSLNSPEKLTESHSESKFDYQPEDIVRIDRSALSSRGKLHFIFKTQTGRQLAESSKIIE